MKNIFFIIFVSTFLSGCGSINNFFGGDDIDKDRIQGDRISILSLEKNLVSDPKLRDSRVVLPLSKKNLSWQYPGGSLNNSLHNVLGTTTFEYCFHPVGDIDAGSCQQITYVVTATSAIKNEPGNLDISSIGTVYPNPIEGTGWLDYHIRTGDVCDLVFRDLAGKEIMRESGLVLSGKVAIHSEKLTQGLCFCTLEINGIAVRTERFVVVR